MQTIKVNRHTRIPFFVYAAFAQADADGYIKFGISGKIGTRLAAIRTHCPIPIHFICTLDVGDRESARKIEKLLHSHFSDRKVTGEWYRFDLSSEHDKKEFNDGCKSIFIMEIGPGHWWEKINVDALIEHDKERRRNLIHSGKFRLIQKRAIEQCRIKKAWKELSEPNTC